METYYKEIMDIIGKACEMFYNGESRNVILPLMKEAKRIHKENGGSYSNWIGATDDREIFRDYPYSSI